VILAEPHAFSAETTESGRLLFAPAARFIMGVVALDGLPSADRAEVCFAGRSNVGKSSLINALVDQHGLARASAEPGRTREINYFDVGDGRLYLVDLPGFGYAKVSRTQAEAWMRLTRGYLRGRPTLRRVFLLVDARRGLMDTDLDVMDMLDASAVIYQLVLTKADKVDTGDLAARESEITAAIRKRGAAHPVVRITSAEKRLGIAELRAEIAQLL
jgi:GTP-binding protein